MRIQLKVERDHFGKPFTASFVMMLLILLSIWSMFSYGHHDLAPTRKEVWGNGPLVNRSVVELTLNEGFDQITGPDFLMVTGSGAPDLFYDPNYQWREGGKNFDLPYGNHTFTAAYPSGHTDKVKITFVHYYLDTNFGYATLTCQDINFNSLIYGKEFFDITIFAENRSGISKATLRLRILNVNDAPVRSSSEDFYSIAFHEDTVHHGINRKNMMPNEIFSDPADPFDTLTFKVEPVNDNALNIEVDCALDGSNISFRPKENWSSQYLIPSERLSGGNHKEMNKYFAKFLFNISDQDGARVPARDSEFYVYIIPVNDPPVMDDLQEISFKQDTLVKIQYSGTDPDMEFGQTIRFNHNLTTSIFERTGEQIEFIEDIGYKFDHEKGIVEFKTNNKLVGRYDISAWVRDRSTLPQTPPDYPLTPYPVYANYTLVIENVNDPPTAIIDSPFSNFPYNTSYPIEFNASRTRDPDLIHGQELNYTWLLNGRIIGYGMVLLTIVPNDGFYNVTLNVTDGHTFSLDHRDITVRRARVYGEIFKGRTFDHEHSDPQDDQLVLRYSQEGVTISYEDMDSIDIVSIKGIKVAESSYRVTARFSQPLEFVYTGEKTQEPTLNIYFVKPEFIEDPPQITHEMVPGYSFRHPPSAHRYARIELDLRTREVIYSNTQIFPQVRLLSDRMGVEVTFTLVEMDQLGIIPDFKIFARAYMKTVLTNVKGSTTIIQSYDTIGHNASEPVTEVYGSNNEDNGEKQLSSSTIVLIGALIIITLMILVIVGVLIVISKRKKEETPPPDSNAEPNDDDLDMIMSGGIASAPAPQPMASTSQPARSELLDGTSSPSSDKVTPDDLPPQKMEGTPASDPNDAVSQE
ncbi:MAG: hypothetical protein QCI82_05985 [Candidatus Thermoplasmatota archaeon]|nr:hypothetical protein [Candidatus Thermoplasmatota archaeon]